MKVTYDQKVLMNAFNLANRVAPTSKGGAWDKAAGMVMDIEPDGSTTVMATDIDTAVQVCFDAEELKDEEAETVRWRMSSLFLAPWVQKLSKPISVEKDTKKNGLIFRSGSTKLFVPLMSNTDYPTTFQQPPGDKPPSDTADLTLLADRVMWACDTNSKGGSPLVGLHADGENIVGCRHEGLAMLAVPLQVDSPITFQARELIGLLKGYSEVRISADATRVFLWLNDTDWVSANLIVSPYPQYKRLTRTNFAHTVKVNRLNLLDCLDRMSIVASQDRGDMPRVDIAISKGQLALKVNVKDVGESDEAIRIEDGPEEPFRIGFSLSFLMDAVKNSEGMFFELSFGDADAPANGDRSSCRLTDETGWEALLMPRR